ncbi:MAG: glycosyltransferase family 4 protein, partial [Propionibacteriaceae bacterium]|nr:glycosyltransferase family 4 protein [Propionibacteriaceae bacterium]
MARPLVLVDLLSYTGTKGGMETYARQLYGAIGTSNHEFDFVGMASREGAKLDLDWFPGEVYDSGITGEGRVRWAVGELFDVSRHARRHKAALVHCPATLGPRRTEMPTVITLHDTLYWSHPEFMTTPLYTEPVKWMEVQAARNATKIITDSQVSKDEIVKYLGTDPAKIDVVWLAGTPEASNSASTRRRDLILATGNRRPHKNFVSLVKALPLIAEPQRPQLVITGSRGDDPLRPVVAELGLERWVELKQWVSDEELTALHAEATALAMPSLQEGFCLPVVDAMMAGLPCLLSDLPIFHEVAAGAALYYPP